MLLQHNGALVLVDMFDRLRKKKKGARIILTIHWKMAADMKANVVMLSITFLGIGPLRSHVWNIGQMEIGGKMLLWDIKPNGAVGNSIRFEFAFRKWRGWGLLLLIIVL